MYTFPTHIKHETLHVPIGTNVRACVGRRALRELSKNCPHTYYAQSKKLPNTYAMQFCKCSLTMQFDNAVLHFQNAIAVLTFPGSICSFDFSGDIFRFDFSWKISWWDFHTEKPGGRVRLAMCAARPRERRQDRRCSLGELLDSPTRRLSFCNCCRTCIDSFILPSFFFLFFPELLLGQDHQLLPVLQDP